MRLLAGTDLFFAIRKRPYAQRHHQRVFLAILPIGIPQSVLTDYPAIGTNFLASLGQLASGTMFFPLFHDVKDQFNPGGDAKFVIDAEQIVAHRVLSNAKS